MTSCWFYFVFLHWSSPLLIRWGQYWCKTDADPLWSAVVPCWRSTVDPSEWNSTDHRKRHYEGQRCREGNQIPQFWESRSTASAMRKYYSDPIWFMTIHAWVCRKSFDLCFWEIFRVFPDVCLKLSISNVDSLKQIILQGKKKKAFKKLYINIQKQIRAICETFGSKLFSPFFPVLLCCPSRHFSVGTPGPADPRTLLS